MPAGKIWFFQPAIIWTNAEVYSKTFVDLFSKIFILHVLKGPEYTTEMNTTATLSQFQLLFYETTKL